MADRISRPPVRMKAGLPDGNLNGGGDLVRAGWLNIADPDAVFAVVRFERDKLEIAHDVYTAVIRVSEIEFPAGEQDKIRELLEAAREDRTGERSLFPAPEPDIVSDAQRAADLARRFEAWCGTRGKIPREQWVRVFGDDDKMAPVGPVGASLTHLIEACAELGVPMEDPADDDPPPFAGNPDDPIGVDRGPTEEEARSNVRSIPFRGPDGDDA
jgi:hypothetical protein